MSGGENPLANMDQKWLYVPGQVILSILLAPTNQLDSYVTLLEEKLATAMKSSPTYEDIDTLIQQFVLEVSLVCDFPADNF